MLRPAFEGYIHPLESINPLKGELGHFAWVKQEKHKGNHGIVSTSSGGPSGGWDINKHYVGFLDEVIIGAVDDDVVFPTPPSLVTVAALEDPETIFALPKENFIEEPLFEKLNEQTLHELEVDKTTILKAHAHELAYSIPALSDPAGSTMIISEGTEINQLDMNGLIEGNRVPGKWPEAERRDTREWWHSDFKDMAYLYVYRVYDDMVQTANLRGN